MHILNRPALHTLASGWAALAEGEGDALRLRPDHGPFGAAAGNGARLAALIPLGGELWLVERQPTPPPTGGHVLRRAELHQRVAETLRPKPLGFDAAPLGEADAPAGRHLPRSAGLGRSRPTRIGSSASWA